VRAGLREEVSKFVEHVSTIGITRLGLIYEDSPNAAALLAALEEAAAASRAKVVAKASSARMADAVTAMQAATPQAILIVTSGAVAAGFIEQYRGAGGAAQLFAQSGADVEQLSKRLGEEQMQGIAIMQVTPSPYLIRTRLAKEFSDAAAAAAAANGLEVPVSYTMMEGFIACKVIVEAVRRQGARPSREGMTAALDSMSGYDMGGYAISYKPGMRSGSRLVELSIISAGGKIRQ
jgi:ABC-type branched-subunit amino acid transport system substrate-binding protein